MPVRRAKICMLSTGHAHMDDRIYYKEALSLLSRFGNVVLVASGKLPGHVPVPKGIEFVSLGEWKSVWSRFASIPKAVRAVWRIKPDVCHFHDFELIFALPFLRLFCGCKLIFDVHEVFPETAIESTKIPPSMRTFVSRLISFSERALSRFADYIITTDDGINERFSEFHGKVTTVFNYPRLELFTPDEKKVEELRERYRGRTPVIYCGGMGESKGLFQMLKAMNILREKRPEVILLLAGQVGGNDLRRAKKEIAEFGIAEQVDFLGFIPHQEVVNHICVSKAGLICNLPTPKWFINVPIKQFEYMACGVPVLGPDLPPVASYINACGCGKVFDSADAASLASAIDNILSDETQWTRMAEAGRKAVGERWNWDEMEKRLFLVYEELLKTQ